MKVCLSGREFETVAELNGAAAAVGAVIGSAGST